MGWWQIEGSQDFIGDRPLDSVHFALKDLIESYFLQAKPLPKLEEILTAMAAVLNNRSIELLADTEDISFQGLIAELEPTKEIVFSDRDGRADTELIEVFSELFEDISHNYQLILNRKPRMRELLLCVEFTLRSETENYLLLEEGITIKEIIAQTSENIAEINRRVLDYQMNPGSLPNSVKYKPGDIFAFPLTNDQYMFGRIMLDIEKQCVKPKLIDSESPLLAYSKSLLIEVYREVRDSKNFPGGEILIPGFFLDPEPIKLGEWEIVGYQKIDPIRIDFPEILAPCDIFWALERGEIRELLPEDLDENEDWIVREFIVSPYALPDICLNLLGMDRFIQPTDRNSIKIEKLDLRFSPHRTQIYQMLEEDENQSYYEMSSKSGFDVTRFYE